MNKKGVQHLVVGRLPPSISYTKLSNQIANLYKKNNQNDIIMVKKLLIRDRIYAMIITVLPNCGLYVVGSSANGFGGKSSDVDMCLVVTQGVTERDEAMTILQGVKDVLATANEFIESQVIIPAKVPILRITLTKPNDSVIVDINFNNIVALRNTHLLHYYASYDERIKPLVCAVKEWADKKKIHSAHESSFSSYSLVLMVIHFCQNTEPKILPCLQKEFPKLFSDVSNCRELDFTHTLLTADASQNTSNLGELLHAFFKYYCNFPFGELKISVRDGDCQKLGFHYDRSVCSIGKLINIEEPFSRLNAAHSIYKDDVFETIKKAFIDGERVLSESRDFLVLCHTPSPEEQNQSNIEPGLENPVVAIQNRNEEAEKVIEKKDAVEEKATVVPLSDENKEEAK